MSAAGIFHSNLGAGAFRASAVSLEDQEAFEESLGCRVFAILQQTGQDSEEHINCIRFFWLALLEYQRGCNYGLKRPLKLLKSLMLRLIKVAQNIDMEEPADEI